MVECPAALKDYIKNNAAWFENTVVACCRTNMELFNKVSPVLCLSPGKKLKHTDDFEIPFNNILYVAIREYNKIFLEAKISAFLPMGEPWLLNWLNTQASKAEIIMLSEIPEVLKHFNENILTKDTSDSAVYLVNTGLGDYLGTIRAKKIINRASLTGINVSDLALLCDGDLKSISTISGESRLINDVPDRIGVDEIPLFIDKKKSLLTYMTCDLPALNDVLGGGFNRGGSYMFIGTTGAGKTVCACQLAASFTYGGGHNGLYISTEQQYGELYPRLVSNRCSILYSKVLRGVDKDLLSELDLKKYIAFRESNISTSKLRFINWGNFEKSEGFNVGRTIEHEIDMFEEETGRKLDFIILDWIGGALSTLAADRDSVRHIYQNTADDLEKISRKRNVVVIAFAQAHTRAINKLTINSNDLAECTGMPRNYTGIIGITSLYSEAYARVVAESEGKRKRTLHNSDTEDADMWNYKQYFFVSKSRFGTNKAIPFKRDYIYQRMAPWV